MITSEPTPGRDEATSGPATSPRDPPVPSPDLPLTRLRGAGVDVDARRAGRLVLGVCLAALAVVAVILVVAGVDKNAQTVRLRDHGVPVAVTVSGCEGLLGGSGSNAAGYACKGTYVLDGHRYQQSIPGSTALRVGEVIRGVTVPSDPYLLSTPAIVAAQHASWRVFIAPVILVGILVLAVVTLLAVKRRRRGGGSANR